MDRLDTPQTRIALAALLIAAGILLLATQMFGGTGGLLWPFFIIVPGTTLLVIAARTGWQASLASAGAIVAGVGVILLVQSLFGYYRSWAYAWTLLPLFAGAALYYSGLHRSDAMTRERGQSLMQWSLGAFAVLGVVFELLLFDGGNAWGRYLVPLGLVVVGVLLLARRHPRSSGEPQSASRQGADETPRAPPVAGPPA